MCGYNVLVKIKMLHETKVMKMLKKSITKDKPAMPVYTPMEELLNTLSHGVGALLAIWGVIALVIKNCGDKRSLPGILIYGATLFTLYSVSSIYHALPAGNLKSVFRKFDHCSIFLLIAGTYTPLCMNYITETAGTVVLLTVWAVAVVGIILNLIDVNKFSKISMVCYLVMGWSVVFISKPAMRCLSYPQLQWLFIGGIFYSVGAVLYVIGKKVKYIHFIWHLFVLTGSICHYQVLVI